MSFAQSAAILVVRGYDNPAQPFLSFAHTTGNCVLHVKDGHAQPFMSFAHTTTMQFLSFAHTTIVHRATVVLRARDNPAQPFSSFAHTASARSHSCRSRTRQSCTAILVLHARGSQSPCTPIHVVLADLRGAQHRVVAQHCRRIDRAPSHLQRENASGARIVRSSLDRIIAVASFLAEGCGAQTTARSSPDQWRPNGL